MKHCFDNLICVINITVYHQLFGYVMAQIRKYLRHKNFIA